MGRLPAAVGVADRSSTSERSNIVDCVMPGPELSDMEADCDGEILRACPIPRPGFEVVVEGEDGTAANRA